MSPTDLTAVVVAGWIVLTGLSLLLPLACLVDHLTRDRRLRAHRRPRLAIVHNADRPSRRPAPTPPAAVLRHRGRP
ncbi:hypothetical protein [Nocardioides sp. GY 10127]|uniref:hypothetical protein n=1 Tax=Nocardioides sp. GY 10127 TaxID=2569762 RepID=UPI0010A813C1|nr:hypothetical protein [Nocardioides sp. GY 10127]TIC78809.1 hypothetical protein E8D37_19120 [Nocardioides sp. GY 10127]